MTYAFNQQRGWPTQILWKLGSTAFAQYDLTYDGGSNTVGNLTGVTELDGSTMSYTYDALYRLTAETRTGTGAYSQSYTYDLAGNMTQLNGSSFASYDTTNKISSLTGGSVSYDSDGNTTAISGAGIPSTSLTWSTRNRLLRQQTSSDDLSYKYDASGKRVLKFPTSSPSSKIFYVFSGDTLLGEVSSGTPTYGYTWGASGLVSQRDIGNNLSLWYHFGPQWETRHVTNSSGSVADSYRYDGYGRTLASSGSDFNPFKYGGRVGYYSEGAAGFLLATNRWYSSPISRWLSRDPIEYRGGANIYGYVGSNPILHVDPSGLKVRRCRKWAQDPILYYLWKMHYWLKTDNREGGMGAPPQGGGFGKPTIVVDHGPYSEEPGSECEVIQGVDEDCVNQQLSPGRPLGNWYPWNSCTTFVSDVLEECADPRFQFTPNNMTVKMPVY